MRVLFTHSLLLAAFMLISPAGAQPAYPSKPVRVAIGFPAGSSIDVVSRIVIDDIRTRTGATIVVDNRPGALGSIGIQDVLNAPADGYTLFSSSSATHSSGPFLSVALQKLEPVSSLRHIARISLFDVVVVTSAAGPYANARSLVDAGKAKPDSLTYGYGSGTGQVGSAAFSHAAALQTRGIPYRGQPLAVADLLGAQVDFVSSDLGAVLSLLKSGKLNAVALLADRRSSVLPDVPTAREAGLSPVSLEGWIGFDGPAKMPAAVASWWSEQVALSVASPAVQSSLRNIGMEPSPLAGEAFDKFVRAQYDVWGRHVHEAGLKPE
ncbi:tripartite tricarboxylate transporter substrate binding protein [soil metagenome]